VSAASLDQIVLKIREFYDNVLPNALKVASLLSAISLNANNAKIEIYNLSDPIPRSPVRVDVRLMAGHGAGGHPSEVALVMSFSSVPPPGVPQARRRGRMYLGPLSNQSSLIENAVGDVRPATLAIETLKQAAERMAKPELTGLASWVTRSTIDGAIGVVSRGFVDNAYDTQRRRGTRATNRTSWST
jgi:hypothetical protein